MTPPARPRRTAPRFGVVRRSVGWVFSPPTIGREGALRWSERLGALTAMVASAEYLRGGSQLRRHGLNDPALLLPPSGAVPPVVAALTSPRGNRVLHLSRLAAGAALLAPTGRRLRLAANGHLAVTSHFLRQAEARGLDGSDEVALLVQASSATARLTADPVVADAALWFLALQSAVSYLAAGVAKVAGRTWTEGRAMTGIFRTQAYGHEGVWRFLDAHPTIARRLTRGVVAGEVLLPFLLVRRSRLARTYVAIGGLFHAANAFAMGLGRFFLAFSAFYPAVLYVSSPTARTRSDVLPRAAGGLALALLAGGAAGKVVDDRRLARHATDGSWRFHRTRRGDVLAYRLTEPRAPASQEPASDGSDGETPLVVVEAGLGGTAVHWNRITAGLAERGFTVLAYNRAGYRPSSRASHVAPDLEVLRDDLADLVDAVAGARPIVLVGHSLGGHLAASTAGRMRAPVVAVVTLDSAHPAQWERLERSIVLSQRSLLLTEWSLRLGLGTAIELPWELDLADPADRRVLVAIHRARPTWAAVRWEVEAMLAGAAHRSDPTVPVLAFTASATATAEATQLELDQRLATGGRHVLVDQASHLGLLVQPSAVTAIVDGIAAYVAERLAATSRGTRAGSGADAGSGTADRPERRP